MITLQITGIRSVRAFVSLDRVTQSLLTTNLEYHKGVGWSFTHSEQQWHVIYGAFSEPCQNWSVFESEYISGKREKQCHPIHSSWTESISKYITYFEKNWIFSAAQPPHQWSCNLSVWQDQPCTNNASEGGNNAIKHAAQATHPCIWNFIPIIRKFNAQMEQKLLKFQSGESAVRLPQPRWRKRAQIIKTMVTNYNPYVKMDFIRTLGRKFAFWDVNLAIKFMTKYYVLCDKYSCWVFLEIISLLLNVIFNASQISNQAVGIHDSG